MLDLPITETGQQLLHVFDNGWQVARLVLVYGFYGTGGVLGFVILVLFQEGLQGVDQQLAQAEQGAGGGWGKGGVELGLQEQGQEGSVGAPVPDQDVGEGVQVLEDLGFFTGEGWSGGLGRGGFNGFSGWVLGVGGRSALLEFLLFVQKFLC